MMIRSMLRIGAALLLGCSLSAIAKSPKLPPDAPYCAPPGARQIFVSPAGEPFRAAAGETYPSASWFAAADANRDGAVDRAEFLADARRFFQRIDTDHDGRLIPEEVMAYEHEVAPEIALYTSRPQFGDAAALASSRPGRSGGAAAFALGEGPTSGYGGPMGAGRFAWLNIPEPVASADADVDRVITETEFLAAATRRFGSLDPGGAGLLRLAQLGKTPAQAAIEGPCRPPPKRRKGRRHDLDGADEGRGMPR